MIVCLGEALVDLICERRIARSPRPTRSGPTSAARSPTSPSPRRERAPRPGSPAAPATTSGAVGFATDSRPRGSTCAGSTLLEGATDAGRLRHLRPRRRAVVHALRRGDRRGHRRAGAAAGGGDGRRLRARLQLDHAGRARRAAGDAAGARAGARGWGAGLLRSQHPPQPLGRRRPRRGAGVAGADRGLVPGPRQPHRGDGDRRDRRPAASPPRCSPSWGQSSRWSRSARTGR